MCACILSECCMVIVSCAFLRHVTVTPQQVVYIREDCTGHQAKRLVNLNHQCQYCHLCFWLYQMPPVVMFSCGCQPSVLSDISQSVVFVVMCIFCAVGWISRQVTLSSWQLINGVITHVYVCVCVLYIIFWPCCWWSCELCVNYVTKQQ